MAVNLGQAGQPDFDKPIELMMDCHRRIEHFLEVLERVVQAQRGHLLDAEHARALRAALDYFANGAPHHTADEEQSLFPRMRQRDDARVQQALQAMQRLEADHRTAEQAHARVDELGRRWLGGELLSDERFAELEALLGQLRQGYREHIAMEDEQLFPLAERVLSEQEQARIGSEMRDRRGLGETGG